MKEFKKHFPENTPLTTIVRHAIKHGAEQEFENWVRIMGNKASAYKGFNGRYLIPPKKGDSSNQYTIAFQFEDIETLTTWMDSSERKHEIDKLKRFSNKEMEIEHQEGIDFWFVKHQSVKRPPTWKMAILTWLTVFSGVMLLPKFFKFLFPSFIPVLITLIVTLTLVALMTWVLMPKITQIFKRWLFN